MEGINLRTKNPTDRVALRGVRVHAVLAAMSQRTVVEQTFLNRESHAIEAVYTFPLPDGAAVCAFEVITGDRVLTGVIEETDTAIEKYESAVAAGDAAFMAEQERPDVFTIRVGNIKPRQAALVRLTYVCPLDVNDNQIRVTFPTTVAPRFVTQSGMDPIDAAIDGDALNPPHVLSAPYGLTFSADVRIGRKVKAITSPTHSIQTTGDDAEGYRLALSGTVAMDREVVLNIELAKEVGPAVQFENGKDNQSYLAVTFVPEFDVQPRQPAATETVFVLDCSGSMAGSSIEQAMAALELCLRSLSEGDAFNICKFGSRFELMSPEPVVYSQATLDQAVAYIASRNDLGGTELFAPLQAVMQTPPRTGVVRSVILLTDGQVSNEPALLAMARRHRASNRIFSFGIGAACSSFLVKGLARVTGGAAEFIAEGEKIHEKVLRTFARLSSPLASNVQIDWGGAEAQTLADLPPVFDGEVLTVFARVLGRRPSEVALKCRTSAGEQSWKVAVPSHAIDNCGIGTMWARRTIQSLEEVNGIARTSAPVPGSRERELLIQLSKDFGLLSSLTTYVAVEHRSVEERNEGRPATQRVPVMVPDGWGVLGELSGAGGGGFAAACVAPPSPAQPMAKLRGISSLFGKRAPRAAIQYEVADQPVPTAPPAASLDAGLLDLTRESDESSLGAELFDEVSPSAGAGGGATVTACDLALSADRPARTVSSPRDELSDVLNHQCAVGDFRWDARMDEIAGSLRDWSELTARAEAWVRADQPDRPKVLATMRALLLLRSKFAADEAMWKRSAEKAMRYLAAATGRAVAKIVKQLAV